MKRRVIYTISVFILLFIAWRFFPLLQISYFTSQSKMVDRKLYEKDCKALKDTLYSWGDFTYSPLADYPKEWWIDAILYNKDKSKILFVVNAIRSERSETSYNQSQWILGFRENGKLRFYMSEGSQAVYWIEGSADSDKEEISKIGKYYLVRALYYPFTFIERKDFWDALAGDEEIIKEVQDREMQKWKAERRERDSLKAAK
jgi:hypothetical protein